ncbi:MAG: hypothetical protein H6742_18295 [Alphaproteobacteria bacterium]|nr:hypothetical protein [Alphaproteobacteria bacterium]
MRILLWTPLLLLPLTACFDKGSGDEDDDGGSKDGGGWDLGDAGDSGAPSDGGTTADPMPDTDVDTDVDTDGDTDTDGTTDTDTDADTDGTTDTDTDADTDGTTDTDTDTDTDGTVDPSPWDGVYRIDVEMIATAADFGGELDVLRCTGGRFELADDRIVGSADCAWSGVFSSVVTSLSLDGRRLGADKFTGDAVLDLDGFPAAGSFEGAGVPGELVIETFFAPEETGGDVTIEGEGTLFLP